MSASTSREGGASNRNRGVKSGIAKKNRWCADATRRARRPIGNFLFSQSLGDQSDDAPAGFADTARGESRRDGNIALAGRAERCLGFLASCRTGGVAQFLESIAGGRLQQRPGKCDTGVCCVWLRNRWDRRSRFCLDSRLASFARFRANNKKQERKTRRHAGMRTGIIRSRGVRRDPPDRYGEICAGVARRGGGNRRRK